MGDIRLLYERHLPWILQFNECLNRCAALRLGFQGKAHVRLVMSQMVLTLRPQGKAREHGLQGGRLRIKHRFQFRNVTGLDLFHLRYQRVNQAWHFDHLAE